MDAMQILVIILSICLAIFLVLGIVLVILLIKVSLQIKKVTETAQHAATQLETITSQATRFAAPVALGKLIVKQFKKYKKQ